MTTRAAAGRRPGKVLLKVLAAGLGLPIVGLAAASWWLTAPLEGGPPTAPPPPVEAGADPSVDVADEAPVAPSWPEGRVEGDEAKRILMAIVEEAERRLAATPGYTATFRRRERIRGKLGPEQTIALKVRHRPFSVYMKFLAPKAGREVLYVEGARDNKVMAHNGDLTRLLVPRLVVKPTDPLALADNRHPITDAGLLNLARKLVHFRRLDLDDDDATTVLLRVTDEGSHPWLRAIHDHTIRVDERPFKYVEVDFDPETHFPRRIRSHEWPRPDDPGAEPGLGESYAYDDLRFDVEPTDHDFDPANPSYEFTRF